MRGDELDLAVVRSILETRLHNGPKVAELAARLADPKLAALLDQAVDLLANESDLVAAQQHALSYWDHIVDAADSIAFRLMYNTLRATYEPALPALATVMSAEVGQPEAYRRLAEAIVAGDEPGHIRPRSTCSPRPPPPSSPHWRSWRPHDHHRQVTQGAHAAPGRA